MMQCPSLLARAAGNRVDVTTSGIEAIDVYLSPWLIEDVSAPITIAVNGRVAWTGAFAPSAETLVSDFESRRDLRRLFWQRVRIEIPEGLRAVGVLEREVVVSANQEWVRTGIYLREGMMVSVSATGWIHGCQNARDWAYGPWNPDGRDAAGRPPAPPGSRERFFHLQGRAEGAVFPIGSHSQGPADQRGMLLLGVKDTVHRDNSGSFTVRITVAR